MDADRSRPLAGVGLAVAAITVANLLGGISYLWQKLALEGLPPATVIWLRNFVALALMAVWMTRRGRPFWPYDRRETRRLFLVGNLAYGLPLILGIVGVDWSTSGNGAILILLEPGAILLFSWWLLSESIRRLQVLGIVAGLLGGLLVVTEDAPLGALLAGRHLHGNIALAVHGVLWGLYSPLIKPLADKHRDAVGLTFAPMLLANVLLLPAALWEAPQWQAGPALASSLVWSLWLGLLASFAGTILWTYSLGTLRASTVAPFVFLQPLAGVVAGWLVLDERISADALLGGALIGAGVVLVLWRPRRRAVA